MPHHRVDEFLRQGRVVNRVRQNLAWFWSASTWHTLFRGPFRPLRSVFRSALLSIRNACGVQRSTNNVIPDTRQILHTATTDQHDGVFLQVVLHTRNVSCHFISVVQSHASYFPHL